MTQSRTHGHESPLGRDAYVARADDREAAQTKALLRRHGVAEEVITDFFSVYP